MPYFLVPLYLFLMVFLFTSTIQLSCIFDTCDTHTSIRIKDTILLSNVFIISSYVFLHKMHIKATSLLLAEGHSTGGPGTMSDFESKDAAASQGRIADEPLAILTLLQKAITDMHHIDELFQWLAAQLIEQCQVEAAEIWGLQANLMGQLALQLRTLVTTDTTLPQHVVANNHIAEFASRLFSEQRNYPLQAVNQLFSHYPASTLTRYGQNYIAGYYFHNAVEQLPPARQTPPGTSRPAPFTLAILLFQHERRSHDLLAALQVLLPQTVLIARNRGLLAVDPITPYPPSFSPYGMETPLPQNNPAQHLWLLIPHRRRENELLMSSNPLSRSVDIADKQARRAYSAIDGRKNMDALRQATGLEAQELIRVMKILIAQRRVELYEPGGRPVNPAHFLP
jgi:hypothetical protein